MQWTDQRDDPRSSLNSCTGHWICDMPPLKHVVLSVAELAIPNLVRHFGSHRTAA